MSTEEKSQKTVYLIRHGQSVHNVAPVFQSATAELSPQGKAQAELMAERLATLPVEVLVSSPLTRARQTAEAIARRTGRDIEFSDLFVERGKPSAVDGKPWTDQAAAALYRDWSATLYQPGARVADGENYDDLIKRTDAALDFLLRRPEEKLAVVTHGYFLICIVARVLLGEDITGPLQQRILRTANMENTGITVLRFSAGFEEDAPRWRLWTLNDHAHFAE